MLKINKEKLLKETGFSFETIEELFFYLLCSIEWL